MRFDHLSPTDFESLCFDLLVAVGAEHVNWRKGTPAPSSPSDQGRDIECVFRFSGAGGESIEERRFVECKHHAKAVPPRELDGALAWAGAERPGALHIIASGFLSNPAKAYLDAYTRNNRPAFRIVVWEAPDLERHLSRNSRLLRKYRLAGHSAQLDLLHPEHVRYISDTPLYRLQTLFDVLDALDASERDDFLGWATHPIIQPRSREPRTGRQSLRDFMVDPTDYETFRAKCYAVPVDDFFLAAGIVEFSLQCHFRIADVTRGDEVRENFRRFIAHCQRRLHEPGADPDALRAMIDRNTRALDGVDANLEQNYRRYEAFCEKVLAPLLERRGEFTADLLRGDG